MRTQSRDTSEEVERILIGGYQRLTLEQRFAQVRTLSAGIVAINQAGSGSASCDATKSPASTETVRQAVYRLYGRLFHDTLPLEIGGDTTPVFDVGATLSSLVELLAGSLDVSSWRGMGGKTVGFALSSGIACAVYGFPRMTHDIDLFQDTWLAQSELLQQRLASRFLPSHAASDHLGGASFLDLTTLVKIDLINAVDVLDVDDDRNMSGFENTEGIWSIFTDATTLLVTDTTPPLPMLAPDALLLTQLARYKQAALANDYLWRDLMGVAKIRAPILHPKQLLERARRFGIAPLMEQLLTDSGLLI